MKRSQLRKIIKEELSKSIVENEQWSAGDVSEIMRQLLLTQKKKLILTYMLLMEV